MEAVEALLEHKANVNAQNTMTGATPLHCAAQSMKGTVERRMECIDLLIAHGADVSKPDFFGKTAAEYSDETTPLLTQKLQPRRPDLFQAMDERNLEQVKALVSGDKNENVSMVFLGKTPFLYGLELLLADNADEEDNNDDNQQQDKSKVLEILKILLEAGADVNEIPGADSNNPMAALEGNSSPPLFQVCDALQNAYKYKTASTANTIQVLEETCQLFLQHKAKISPELEHLLHTACRKNDIDFAKLLMDIVGIDPNVKGRQGMTPLQFAARSGKVDMVQYLLSNHPNIDISIQDDRGKTALDAARVNDKQEIVALLEAFAKN